MSLSNDQTTHTSMRDISQFRRTGTAVAVRYEYETQNDGSVEFTNVGPVRYKCMGAGPTLLPFFHFLLFSNDRLWIKNWGP